MSQCKHQAPLLISGYLVISSQWTFCFKCELYHSINMTCTIRRQIRTNIWLSSVCSYPFHQILLMERRTSCILANCVTSLWRLWKKPRLPRPWFTCLKTSPWRGVSTCVLTSTRYIAGRFGFSFSLPYNFYVNNLQAFTNQKSSDTNKMRQYTELKMISLLTISNLLEFSLINNCQ